MDHGAMHDAERCPARSRFVLVNAVWEDIEQPPIRCLSPEEVLERIGEERHPWPIEGHIERLALMGVCVSGMVSSASVPGLREAWDVLSIEGMAEQFGVLPETGGLGEQDTATLEAFSVIRAARNAVQDRRMRRMQEQSKGG